MFSICRNVFLRKSSHNYWKKSDRLFMFSESACRRTHSSVICRGRWVGSTSPNHTQSIRWRTPRKTTKIGRLLRGGRVQIQMRMRVRRWVEGTSDYLIVSHSYKFLFTSLWTFWKRYYNILELESENIVLQDASSVWTIFVQHSFQVGIFFNVFTTKFIHSLEWSCVVTNDFFASEP